MIAMQKKTDGASGLGKLVTEVLGLGGVKESCVRRVEGSNGERESIPERNLQNPDSKLKLKNGANVRHGHSYKSIIFINLQE